MHRQRLLLVALLVGAGFGQPALGAGDFLPDPASVQRHGPAYRFPQAGWIVLHIEGEPYERGYQHGTLLAPEIAAYLRCCAAVRGWKAPAEAWAQTRTITNALFLRRFDKEYLEEMKGIADGASAAGARFADRPIDLLDIAALNAWIEVEFLDAALEATPTGLEGLRFPHAQPRAKPRRPDDHCSAFAATGPATADGKIVFGHITMFALYPSNYYNVWLDIKPAKGQRVLMCGYPGAIQSGMDYYLNDAGLLIAETTIAQTRFDIQGQAEASRIRKASQYARGIDEAVAILKEGNNGLYTNEWLLGDINTNEIALFELGTHKSKLWRSSKDEWLGGTTGFYWGCNNAKDLEVRLETVASVEGRPANVVFRPSDRDRAWQQLYHKYKGKIGVEFGKEAFTTPPLAAAHSLDAKFTTTDLARELKSWALFGPPLGRSWQPTATERQRYPEVKPLVSNPWTILHAAAPPLTPTPLPSGERGRGEGVAVDLDSLKTSESAKRRTLLQPPAWHGTLLPASDGDIWLAVAFAEYERLFAREKALRAEHRELTAADQDELAVALFAYRSAYLSAVRARGDIPLAKIRADLASDEWYRIASGRGVLFLHHLHQLLGDSAFAKAMDDFGRANAGRKVTSSQFQAHLGQYLQQEPGPLFERWLQQSGTLTGPAFSVLSFHAEPKETLIVYGSGEEGPVNREAALALQKSIRERWSNVTIPIKSDQKVTDAELHSHHVLLIGRPDSNRLLAKYQSRLPIRFGSRSFVVRGKTYAHPGSAVLVATDNPLNPRYSLVAFAGLSTEATLSTAAGLMQRNLRPAEVVLLPHGQAAQELVLDPDAAER